MDVIINDIFKDNPTQLTNAIFINKQIEYDWSIETNNGEITFKSVGYTQYARGKPHLSSNQSIELNERGRISFDILQF